MGTSEHTMTTPPARTDLRPWQCKGRCTDCGAKVAGWRRMKACVCGGRVSYR